MIPTKVIYDSVIVNPDEVATTLNTTTENGWLIRNIEIISIDSLINFNSVPKDKVLIIFYKEVEVA